MQSQYLYLLIGLGVAIAIIFVLWRRRDDEMVVARDPLPDDPARCPVRLVVLASEPLALDCSALAAEFQALWDEPLACTAHRPQSDILRDYTLETGGCRFWLTVEQAPLPRGDIAMFETTSSGLSPDDCAALRGHAATATLHYRWDGGDNAPMARQMLKALLALMRHPAAGGYLAVSAVRYVPRAALERICAEHDPLAPVALLLLCTHVMRDTTPDGESWLHSHGLEQFGLPELHVISPAESPEDEELIAHTALYCLTNGCLLQAGQCAELAGGGAFTVTRLPNGAFGHDGLFGMLKLTRIPAPASTE